MWLPLTIGTAFPEFVTRETKRYTRGHFLNRDYKPLVVRGLQGGVIIDMPEENIESYLLTVLDLKWMPTDEELITHLEILIERH